MELALRMIARNDEICSLRSAESGKDLHTTTTVIGQREGATALHFPRRPESEAMKTVQELGKQIELFVDKYEDNAARLLEYWAHNMAPESGLVVFQGRALGGNAPVSGWDIMQLVTEFRGLLRSLRIT